MATASTKTSSVGAGLGLGILAFVNLFNYLDRYVVSALFQSLKASALALSDAKLGSLMSAFLIVYTLAAPVFGALGDRRGRPRLIAFGVFVWSLATTLSGFAASYLWLLAARASVGIGEAAYGTIAPSLLADYFPERRRGRVMAIFFCAIPVGSALGYVLGGWVDQRHGWRTAFFMAGGPGLVLSLLCLLLRDAPRGGEDSAPQGTPSGAAPAAAVSPAPRAPRSIAAETRATYLRLAQNRPYLLTVLGYAAYTFAVGGLAAWMPAFLERVRGFPRGTAAIGFGQIVVVTGLVGTFAGGWLADYCRKHSRDAYLWLSAAATLLAAPFVWAALTTVHGRGAIAHVSLDGPDQCDDREPRRSRGARLGCGAQRLHDPHPRRRAFSVADRGLVRRHFARRGRRNHSGRGDRIRDSVDARSARAGALARRRGLRPRGCAVIRDATDEDLPQITAIYNEVIASTTAVFSDRAVGVEDRREWRRQRIAAGYPVLVAADASGVIGFASFGDFRAWPGYRHTVEHSVHVRADCRGRGIGRALVAALLPRAAALSKHVMIAGVDASNEASIRMHEGLGFERVAHLREVARKFDRWLDLVFLQRRCDS